MRIIKEGHVIPFDCFPCGCRFVVAIKQVKDIDGNYYSNCPECGSQCHTSMSDLARYKEEAVKNAGISD